MRAAGALWCLLLGCLARVSAHISQTKHNFPDPQQDAFVRSLKEYHVSIPTKVDSTGLFLSHHLPHHTPRRHRRDVDSARQEEEVHYQVTVDGDDLHMTLRPSRSFVGPGMVYETRPGREGNISDATYQLDPHTGCHFTGHVKNHTRSAVAIATCKGLHGLLRTDSGDFFIEPVRGHDLTSDPRHPHLIYRPTALPTHLFPYGNHDDDPETGSCGVDESYEAEEAAREVWQAENVAPARRRRRRRKRSVSLERHVELLVVVDRRMMEYYKNEDVDTYILTIINMVSTIYHDASLGNAVNIVLVKVLKLMDDEPGLKITHHADHTLKSFCKWQTTINPPDDHHPNHHDVAILITRYNICSRMNEPCSTLGLAQVSGMCQPHRSCNVNEDTGLALAFTVAHELGHNFDMRHDGVRNACMPQAGPGKQYVMSPQLHISASPLTWSNCSRQSITRFLDRDWGYCLNDLPSEHPFVFPEVPPGVMYDADHQCSLQYGPGSSYCGGIDDLCRTLWCRVDNKCLTRMEAAAQGTICGHNQWCSAGRCVTIGDKLESIDGQWGQWNSWTPCSLTCGAGVSLSERHCDHPPPRNGGQFCLGERRRYRICEMDACPEGSPGVRETQCAEFNTVPYRDELMEWTAVAKTDPLSICQLHCKPVGRFFSVMMRETVVDGTPCRLGSRDMCISGRCRMVGCDWKIDSDAVEDNCGVCHGDGSTCKTVKKEFTDRFGLGYVEAMVIPEGARNIRVEEVAEASNYLALRGDDGHYFLNGGWFIQWSGHYKAAGTVVHYTRHGNKESFSAMGPLREPLHIMLLFQSDNPGVKVKYTVPNANASDARRPVFYWKFLDWTHCTASCGGGYQRSEVVCVEQEAGIVEHHHCNASTKPDDMLKSCNTHMCPARWWMGPWQRCSVTCGEGGTHRRTVLCIRSLGPDNQMALEDHECEGLDKPPHVEPCHRTQPCPELAPFWLSGPWSQSCVDNPCGTERRDVRCSSSEAACDEARRPPSHRACSETCGHWQAGLWSQCTRSCDGGVQYRSVTCVSGTHCDQQDKPTAQQDCNLTPCPTTTSTSETTRPPRRKTLPRKHRPRDENSSIRHRNHHGNQATSDTHPTTSSTTTTINTTSTRPPPTSSPPTRPPVTTTTPVPPDNSYRWTPLFWSKCSAVCGVAGTRRRRVLCISRHSLQQVPSARCAGHDRLAEVEACHGGPCLTWNTTDWSRCSTSCGDGVTARTVSCPEPDRCDPLTRPASARGCNLGPCMKWVTGPWDQCTRSCGEGEQIRNVQCVNIYSQHPSSGCDPTTRPSHTRPCNPDSCPDQTGALESQFHCVDDIMSRAMCRALLRMGQCAVSYIESKCCRTCNKATAHHSNGPPTS